MTPIIAPLLLNVDSNRAPYLTAAQHAALSDTTLSNFAQVANIAFGIYSLPFNSDSWDGYPTARDALLQQIGTNRDALVLAGDTHNAWSGDLYLNGDLIAAEMATPG